MASVPFCPRCGTLLNLTESSKVSCPGCKFDSRIEGEPPFRRRFAAHRATRAPCSLPNTVPWQ